MKRIPLSLLVGMCLCVCCSLKVSPDAKASSGRPSVYGVFVGSSPCGETIRQLLRIPPAAESELIQWKLTLYRDRYELRCEYGLTSPNQPGLARGIKTLERQGAWTTGHGIKSDPHAIVHKLHGAVSLFQVDENVLHVLNPDLSLMIGNGGWSYTLNRAEHAEKAVDPALVLSQPDMSYRISPLATGPTVAGVFEGRSPSQAIARELKIPVDPANAKVKWRVTLYQNPRGLSPTTYKVEGSLHRRGPREGNWALIRGTQKDAKAIVYRLATTETEPALYLLKGDDNVLFFLDQNRKPLVGHAGFSYTLNRRETQTP